MIYIPKTAFPRRHGQKSGFGSVESYAKGPPFWVLTRKVMKFHHFDDIIHLFYNVMNMIHIHLYLIKSIRFMIYIPKTAFPSRHGQKSGFGSVESYAKGPPFWVLTRKVMKFHHFDDIIHLFYNL